MLNIGIESKEFWQGNCKTAEDRYNKLYQEVHK